MATEDRAYTIGDYWLTKRRDGKSPDVWQIGSYSAKSRSVVYRSTKCRDLEQAKAVLRSFEAESRSKHKQDSADAELLPHFRHYILERGPDVKRLDTIKSSFRAWIGFFQQDELTTGVRVADLNKLVIDRFRRWRMGKHDYTVHWGGKAYHNRNANGVSGEAVQRNIEDLRAALHHAEDAGRVTVPKIHSIHRNLRSAPRSRVLTIKELGAMLGYAKEDIGAYRWIALMIATASRPGPALAFDPVTQWLDNILDLHPAGAPKTDKRNAVVPTIPPMIPILEDWRRSPHEQVKSRKTWWRNMRRVLGLGADVNPYTIRHTVATYMDEEGVPGSQLSAIAGHLPSHRGIARTTSRNYLHYNPRNCPKAKRVLTKLFRSVEDGAARWSADHRRTTPIRGQPIALRKPSDYL